MVSGQIAGSDTRAITHSLIPGQSSLNKEISVKRFFADILLLIVGAILLVGLTFYAFSKFPDFRALGQQ